MKTTIIRFLLLALSFSIISNTNVLSQALPKIIGDKATIKQNYLPDYSFAGYHNGELQILNKDAHIILAIDYGAIPNDGLDDSKALINAIEATNDIKGNVVLQLPAGKLILSDILYIKRSHFVLRGSGVGNAGTEIFCPRPMMYLDNPEQLKELREYLIEFDKREIQKNNNIDLPFSQYTWSGGMIWTQVPGERVKSYLRKYDQPSRVLAKVKQGNRGEHVMTVSNINGLKVGDIVQLELFNTEGEKGSMIQDLYKNSNVKIGSHHWEFPDMAIVKQQVEITKITNNKITINSPLTISIKPSYNAQLVEWKHLDEVGIEQLRITFPNAPRIAHHVEPGYNGIYLTRVFNSWVRDVVISNADSGILSEEIANVTIKDIVTEGTEMAHYTVAISGSYNVLVKNLKVYNKAFHSLSFNTLSTKNVYQNCEVFNSPLLDQHSGANHQNLFDNVKVHINPNEDNTYPLFTGGGASYWKPSHGAYSTFWNLNVHVLNKQDSKKPIILDGMKGDGPYAYIVGVNGNNTFKIDYGPHSYKENINESLDEVPSLYDYQLKKRME
ncbi:DUF4955 domain-containing protein [Mariniflexile soesokkakense]|uniref:DUF4955 domain-containing protein n=1 Tax=Mariniflexile soesokkakense TaxID=1343160 RepID=A0ABV0A662_9FLAO